MTLSVVELDAMPDREAALQFAACCGSTRWVNEMVARRPFGTRDVLLDAADEVWRRLSTADWREAFAHHPRIGENRATARVAAASQTWSESEQSRAATSDARVKQKLAEAQRDYEARFGHIFLICAAGKSADEILSALRHRMDNDPETELRVAADEQRQITRLRLANLVSSASPTVA
jgi:OHCU decarboxylase